MADQRSRALGSRALGSRAPRSRAQRSLVVTLAVLLWWWWPGLTGDPSGVDVRLAIGAELEVADQSIDRRLREEGFRLERTVAPLDWCDAADLVAQAPGDGSRLVVWARSSPACAIDEAAAALVSAAGGRRLVIVHLPTDDRVVRDAFTARGVRVVDAERLLGAPGSVQECVWWEDCPASGGIEPWEGDLLGSIGGERLARMIVTEVL